jgi:hypothetical protein
MRCVPRRRHGTIQHKLRKTIIDIVTYYEDCGEGD